MSTDPIRIRWSEPAAPPRGSRVRGWVDRHVAGQRWWVRAPLIPILAWFLWRHLNDPAFAGIYDGLNLALHEAGHALFMWFGVEFLTIAGGTLLEIACPIFAGIVFWRQRDVFALAVASFWLGTVFLDIAPYAADARAQLLPLVSLGDGPVGHDWFEMLWRLDLLRWDQTIAGAFRTAGLVTLAASIAAGAWVLWRMRVVNGDLSGGAARDPSEPTAARRGAAAGGVAGEEERLRRFLDERGGPPTG